MARLNQRRTNYRALARIEQLGKHRAERIARFIIEQIHSRAPYDDRAKSDTTGPHLKDSYYLDEDPKTGGIVIKCSRRYWVYVEYGTNRVPDKQDKRPHVRPSIDAAKAKFG